MIIILDTFPTSSVAKGAGTVLTLSDRCNQWVYDCEKAGHGVIVPAISYYEALRESEQRQAAAQLQRLQAFCLHPTRFLPLTTAHIELATQLWGQVRRAGKPTASNGALNGDVLLAAQALSLGLAESDFLVATTNVAYLSRFVPCDEWQNIKP